MSEILITDVTVAVTERRIEGRKKVNRGTITFGDSFLAMPVGGIPLPRLSAFGFISEMQTLTLSPTDDNSLQPYVYNATSNRLVPLDTDMSPEVEGKVNELNAHTTGAGAGATASTTGAEDRPLTTVLNFVATGW